MSFNRVKSITFLLQTLTTLYQATRSDKLDDFGDYLPSPPLYLCLDMPPIAMPHSGRDWEFLCLFHVYGFWKPFRVEQPFRVELEAGARKMGKFQFKWQIIGNSNFRLS